MRVRSLTTGLLTAVAAVGLSFAAPAPAGAQISFGVNIGGPAPLCPYGYYGYAPYNCAPSGYYGQQWFNGGAFVGAGPWYRGRPGFYGPVNNGFDPRYGYHGGFPNHGGYREPQDHFHNFHGNDFHGAYGEGRSEGFHDGGRGFQGGHDDHGGGGHDDHGGGHDDHGGGGHDDHGGGGDGHH